MTICLRCGRDTGFLGFLRVNYNKQTRHCRKCEDEVQRTLEDFRTAFLELTRDGTLTPQKWEILAKSATDDKIEIDTILTFIHQDILNLLDRILTDIASNDFVTRDDENNFQYLLQVLDVSNEEAQPALERLAYLKKLSNIRSGALEPIRPSIRLDTDEFCFLERLATYHKVNAKSTSRIPGRFVVSNKKLRFLSQSAGGTDISWHKVMRIEAFAHGVILELSQKTYNGFYEVDDPPYVEAIIDTALRIAKQQLLVTRSGSTSRHIPHEVRTAVWQRDQGKCVVCGTTGLGASLEYDHVIPFSKGGANTVNNVQLLCRSCNLKKGDRI